MSAEFIDRVVGLDRIRELTAMWRAEGNEPLLARSHLHSLGSEMAVKIFIGSLMQDGLLKSARDGRYKVWRLTDIEKGMYRCFGCGDAKQLYGCAEAIIYGRVDGPESVTLDDEEQIGLCAGSIECVVHHSTEPLQRFDGYRWVAWITCEDCMGRGVTLDLWYGRGAQRPCVVCKGRGGWWPGLGQVNPFGAH